MTVSFRSQARFTQTGKEEKGNNVSREENMRCLSSAGLLLHAEKQCVHVSGCTYVSVCLEEGEV